MPIVFDPSKKLINLETMYIEKRKPHGHVITHYIQSKSEYDELIKKGYKTEEEIKKIKASESSQTSEVPGAPKAQLNYDPNKVIYKITSHWKTPNWKEHNIILAKSIRIRMSEDGKQYAEIDNITFNEEKMKLCLQGWDLTNENGGIVPVNSDTIDNLPPDLGNELITAFNEATQIGENDLKNL